VSAATRIAAKDLRLRLRDRSAIIIGIVAPLALALILSTVFGSAFDSSSLDLQYGIVDLDQTDISGTLGEILKSVEAEEILTVTAFGSAADAEAAIEEGEISVYYLIEPGLGAAVVSQQDFTIGVIGDVDAPTSAQIATSIAEQFGLGISTAQLSVGTAVVVSNPPASVEQIGLWGQQVGESGQAFVISDVSAETRQLDQTTYFAASMAVFFLFFTVQFGVLGLLEEERDGTLPRLMAAPIGRTTVVSAKAILSFALGLISMTVLVVATSFPPMQATWGAPLGVLLLVVAGVLSAVAIMGLVASVAKTPEGAGNLASIIAVTLGLLGGVFFPLGQGDDFLAKLTLLTPHAWFMRGLGDLAGGAEWTAALPAVGALLLFAVVFGSISWVFLLRRLRR
jgi:ABC-2 type transport system permease protein